jgi:hypothetical protein
VAEESRAARPGGSSQRALHRPNVLGWAGLPPTAAGCPAPPGSSSPFPSHPCPACPPAAPSSHLALIQQCVVCSQPGRALVARRLGLRAEGLPDGHRVDLHLWPRAGVEDAVLDVPHLRRRRRPAVGQRAAAAAALAAGLLGVLLGVPAALCMHRELHSQGACGACIQAQGGGTAAPPTILLSPQWMVRRSVAGVAGVAADRWHPAVPGVSPGGRGCRQGAGGA